MSSNKILMPLVDRGILLQILSTAVETGSCDIGMGWGQVEEFKWRWWYHQPDGSDGWYEYPSKLNPALTSDTPLFKIRDVQEMEDRGLVDDEMAYTDVTFTLLQFATQWALINYNHLFSYRVTDGKITDIDYDSIGADVILQKAVIGEVLYG